MHSTIPRNLATSIVALLLIASGTRCNNASTQSSQNGTVSTGNGNAGNESERRNFDDELRSQPSTENHGDASPSGDAGSTAASLLSDASTTGSNTGTGSLQDAGALLSPELAAYERARPVFQRFCGNCHINGAPMWRQSITSHFDMGHYPFTGHHSNTITITIRRVLGANGRPPTMPPRAGAGSVRGEDLQLILAWADAYDRAHPQTATNPH